MNYNKVANAILYYLNYSRRNVSTGDVAKFLYYTESYHYQQNQKTFLQLEYVHIGSVPYPSFFYEVLHDLSQKKAISILPVIQKEKLTGFHLEANRLARLAIFSKTEKKALRVVGYAFREGVQKEAQEFPNLYQNYVMTDIFDQIKIRPGTVPRKVRLPKKPFIIRQKSLFYRIFFD